MECLADNPNDVIGANASVGTEYGPQLSGHNFRKVPVRIFEQHEKLPYIFYSDE